MPHEFADGEILTAANLNSHLGMVPLDEVTPTSGSSVSFATIPADFTHLRIVGVAKHDNGSATDSLRLLAVRFNSDSGLNYDFQVSRVDGSTLTHDASDNVAQMSLGAIGDAFGPFLLDVPNYTSANFKTAQSRGAGRTGSTTADTRHILSGTGLWQDGSAITDIDLVILAPNGDAFNTGTKFTLYGLRDGA